MKKLGTIQRPRERDDFIKGALRHTATLNMQEAMDWVHELPARHRNAALLSLLCQWTGQAELGTDDQAFAGGRRVGSYALELLEKGKLHPEQIEYLARNMSDADRARMLADAAKVLVVTDPVKAWALGNSLHDDQLAGFRIKLVEGWAGTDSVAAWEWTSLLETEKSREPLQAAIVAREAHKSFISAASLLANMKPSGVRCRALEEFTQHWAGKDTNGCMMWAESLSDATDRAIAETAIHQIAPIGIGISIGGDPDSEEGVWVSKILPDGAASRNGGISQGDRILRVKNAAGLWQNVVELDMPGLVAAIRGEANTSVSLEVQANNDGHPRIVTIARERIIHRSGQ
ncbi:MAG: PDZ domain-containing protein [Verrucomicrobiota bacterium]